MNDSARRTKPDWPAQIADRVLRSHEQRLAADGVSDRPVVVASGISPSGPIHLGNLRELVVPHYVAEEIRSRGVACDHLLSWDDYDRLRKVPAGVSETFAEHIGKPLTAVPDPEGELDSWADRFKAPLREAMERLGIPLREISQTEMYRSGSYRSEILTALDARGQIDRVLDRFRTLELEAAGDDDGGDEGDGATETGAEDGDDEDRATGEGYWPYKVYCRQCQRDLTEIVSVERGEDSCIIEYRCQGCGHHDRFDLFVENHGKLVWKVDWPMRWAYEGVTFEAGGADHSSPGSSFSVGAELVGTVFGGRPPEYEAYSFVGIRGMAKMSSSAGNVPTPADALRVLEPPILRWMYGRKTPRQSITVDLGTGIHQLYDEWDSLAAKVASGDAAPGPALTHRRASQTSVVERFEGPEIVVPFRTLASAVSVAAGDPEQLARIVSELTEVTRPDVPRTEPRLAMAGRWIDELAPASERIEVRTEPDTDRLGALTEAETRWVGLLVDHLDDDWTLEGVRTLAYGVPKLAAGLTLDAPPSDELKVEQRSFFKLLYELFLSSDTGPRIPTLLMAMGQDRVRHLLGELPTDGSTIAQ